MFNVTDGRDTNFGVDCLLLFCQFYLRAWTRLILSNTYVRYINWLLYRTPEISNRDLVFLRDENNFVSQTDILAKSAIFDNTPI